MVGHYRPIIIDGFKTGGNMTKDIKNTYAEFVVKEQEC